MCNFKGSVLDAENGKSLGVPDALSRKSFKSSGCHSPGRSSIEIMLLFLLLLRCWRAINIDYILKDALLGDNFFVYHNLTRRWTLSEIEYFVLANDIIYLLFQMPGALFIFKFSSYKFLLISTTASSVLHVLTPVAASLHSISFLIVLFGQTLLEAPLYIAVLTMFKDWASPSDNCTFIVYFVLGKFIGYVYVTVFPDVLPSNLYLTGVVGLMWVLLWSNIESETPKNDPESELLFSEGNEKKNIKDIPWRTLINSKLTLFCLIFLKMSISGLTIMKGILLYSVQLKENHLLYVFIPVFLIYLIIITFSFIFADYFMELRSEKGKLFIRKCLACGGFLLQCCFMCGIAVTSSALKNAIFFLLSYLMYAASFPGFFTVVLDLSPRYVAVVVGILYTFSCIGDSITDSFFKLYFDASEHMDLNRYLILDFLLTLVCAFIFYKSGSYKDQHKLIISEEQKKISPDTGQHNEMKILPETFTKPVTVDDRYVCHI